jgi:hypothetical protein
MISTLAEPEMWALVTNALRIAVKEVREQQIQNNQVRSKR